MNIATPEFDLRPIHRHQKPLVGTPTIERLLLRHVSLVAANLKLVAIRWRETGCSSRL